VKDAVRLVVQTVLAPVLLPLLFVAAFAARRETSRRQRADERPRLLYGPTPIISIKYMREAMERAGYEARTVVYSSLPIFADESYDYRLEHFMRSARAASAWRRAPAIILGPVVVFVWALRRFDVFHFFFDGGLLAGTPFRLLEVQLLHLAGKKVVVFPYGSDVAVTDEIRNREWREGLVATYPQLKRRQRTVRRQVRYFCKRADFVVGCIVHDETLLRNDLLTTHYYPIDTDAWQPTEDASDLSARVTVFHAPNHPLIKGTKYLVDAVGRLEAEGVPIELVSVSGIPNEELKRTLASCDILGEQFVLGYGIAAMEGMSLGKPVLSNLTDDRYYADFRQHTGLDECPIVSTTPEELEEALRALVQDESERERRRAAGREYVLKYHSYESVSRMWELVYRKLWHGEDLELTHWHPDRTASAAT
jgi:glycosyltransferase involved in cell wall biosynthesis